jgi:phosphatidate cytidylyltransferase
VKRRVIAGLIALAPVLLALWYGGLWWVLLLTFFTGMGAYEYYVLIERSGYRPARWFGFAWALALFLSFWSFVPLQPELVLTFGFIIIFIRILLSQQGPSPQQDGSTPDASDPRQSAPETVSPKQDHIPFHNWALTVAGATYFGLMMGQALALRLLPNGLYWMLLGLAVTMVNDSAAYFVGVTMGRKRILPALSPKKSWEGTVGGWIAATLTGAAVAFLSPLELAVWLGASIGLVGGILALFGDLAISMLKRQIGVKDSGLFLPGHGGFLDRLDSIMFVLPFVYQMALLLGAG